MVEVGVVYFIVLWCVVEVWGCVYILFEGVEVVWFINICFGGCGVGGVGDKCCVEILDGDGVD